MPEAGEGWRGRIETDHLYCRKPCFCAIIPRVGEMVLRVMNGVKVMRMKSLSLLVARSKAARSWGRPRPGSRTRGLFRRVPVWPAV